MLDVDNKKLFSYLRGAPFGGRLTQEQVEGTHSILTACKVAGVTDKRHIAYILATAFHETGGRMVAVREGFAKNDAQARRIIGHMKYGKPDPKTGHVYYGRGHVQLTWAANYKRMGHILGIDLYNNPDLALDKNISAQILVEGMARGRSSKGDFTGKALEDYFNVSIEDPLNARRIVNGMDRASLIAGYYKNCLDALNHAQKEEEPYYDADTLAEPDKPNFLTDKTMIGGAAGMASTGSLGAVAMIDSPYALVAFVVISLIAAFFAFMFFTGRFDIAKKAGT